MQIGQTIAEEEQRLKHDAEHDYQLIQEIYQANIEKWEKRIKAYSLSSQPIES